MACTTNTTPALPQQPNLRSYIVYDQLPVGCLTLEVTDHSVAPHVRAGEFAVFDPNDCDPMHGELFVIEWSNGKRQVVECERFAKERDIIGWDGQQRYYNAVFANHLVNACGGSRETHRWFDGPYRDYHLAEKLKGRIVGIYQPAGGLV